MRGMTTAVDRAGVVDAQDRNTRARFSAILAGTSTEYALETTFFATTSRSFSSSSG